MDEDPGSQRKTDQYQGFVLCYRLIINVAIYEGFELHYMLYVVFIAASPSNMPTSEVATLGLSTTTVVGMCLAHIHSHFSSSTSIVSVFLTAYISMECVGVAVGIIVFLIVVIVTMMALFAVIMYRMKRAPRPKHQNTDISNYNEQDDGYEAIPFNISVPNKSSPSHQTISTAVHNGEEEEYMTMSGDALAPSDHIDSNKPVPSDDIYENDDEIELMKRRKASASSALENKEKCDVTQLDNHKTSETTLSDSYANKDDSGYVAIIPISEKSDATKHD